MTPTAALSRFEANLVRILRFFLRSGSVGEAVPLIFQRLPRPACLSGACVRIVQDTLAKGCVRLLAGGDGWRRERFLRGNQIADGLLWQRTAPRELGLRFSRHTMDLLLWFTAEDASDVKARRRRTPLDALTPADALVCYYAYTALRETEAASALPNRLGFGSQSLCWLAFPQDFVTRPGDDRPDFSPWMAGAGACILEALQSELTERVLAVERGKSLIAGSHAMEALGTTQERILDALVGAADLAGRRDLVRFLLVALYELMPPSVKASTWIGGLREIGPRLADRTATYRRALALIRRVDILRDWSQWALAVGYFDEDYAASQLWKADWERWQGEILWQRAQALFHEIDAFATPGTR